MKILIFILLLIPAFGFAQINTEALNSFPGGNFNLYSIDAKSIEGYSFKATTSQNALASSNLNLDDEYKMLLDSFYLYYFNYQSDTTTVIREYYQYDNHGNQTLFSKYIPCESCVEVTRKIESSYDEDGHLLMKMSFYWDYIRKLWINGRKDIYTYELNGSLTSISNWWDEKDGLWKDTVKIVKSYDVHGNILLEISSRYESNTGLWINLTKNKYSYKDGKCTIHISYKWDEGTSQWTNVSKEESEFNVNGNENVFSNYYWKSLSNQWVSSSRVIESYSPEGKMINYIHFRWDTTSTQWINVHKEDYTFDSNGNEILKIYWDWDNVTNQWRGDFKIESIYNDKQLLTSRITNRWNLNGSNEWNLRSKADFEYDHDGNVILTTSYSWRLADKVWYISNKSHYYYSLHDLTNNSDIKETPQVKLYPNPAHEAFTLEVNDPSVSQCQIFNSGGQLIKSLPVQIGANAFNISNLQKGLYLVKIKTEKGIIISKMVKN